MTMPATSTIHDHVYRCTCDREEIANDCDCPTPVTYQKCQPCRERDDYDRAERSRNADY